MRGITTCRANRPRGEIRNSTRLSVTICGFLDQSGLPRVRSSATTCGHGTQARQPPSSGSLCHTTARLPLMANGRCSSSETLALSGGLIRFQSKNTRTNTTMAINKTKLAQLQAIILRVRVIAQDSRLRLSERVTAHVLTTAYMATTDKRCGGLTPMMNYP